MNSPHKGPVTWTEFLFHDVIIVWIRLFSDGFIFNQHRTILFTAQESSNRNIAFPSNSIYKMTPGFVTIAVIATILVPTTGCECSKFDVIKQFCRANAGTSHTTTCWKRQQITDFFILLRRICTKQNIQLHSFLLVQVRFSNIWLSFSWSLTDAHFFQVLYQNYVSKISVSKRRRISRGLMQYINSRRTAKEKRTSRPFWMMSSFP